MGVLNKRIFDTIIIGGGPAGMTASVYLARKNVKHLVISQDFGGQVNWTSSVENYMGFRIVEGRELMQKFFEQVKEFNIQIEEGEHVTEIGKESDGFYLRTESKKIFYTKTILIATGKKPRNIGVPGEKELIGRGVSYCSTCDAPLYMNLQVAIIGGGNSALTSAMDLIIYASKIYVLNNINRLIADSVLIKKVKGTGKVEFFNNVKIIEIIGTKRVEGIVCEINGIKKQFSLNGVFIEIGLVPNTDFLGSFLKLNTNREIEVDSRNRTSVQGVFAAGDVTDIPEKQIIIASGEGAKAALSIYKYLLGNI